MTKGERFSVVTAVVGVVTTMIGLIADAFTIVDHVGGSVGHFSTTASLEWLFLMAVTISYGWLIVAWFLTKWRFLKDKEQTLPRRTRKADFPTIAFRVVLFIGILLSPLILRIGRLIITATDSNVDLGMSTVVSLFIGAIVGIAILGALSQGMPLIYDEIE